MKILRWKFLKPPRKCWRLLLMRTRCKLVPSITMEPLVAPVQLQSPRRFLRALRPTSSSLSTLPPLHSHLLHLNTSHLASCLLLNIYSLLLHPLLLGTHKCFSPSR